MDEYELWEEVAASPDEVYEAWLHPDQHPAFRDHPPGERFGQGRPLVLEPGRRIVQAWRAAEFPEDAPESRVEVVLDAITGGTRVTLRHSDVPTDGRDRTERGWREYYLDPLRLYFAGPPDAEAEARWRQSITEAEREAGRGPVDAVRGGRTRR